MRKALAAALTLFFVGCACIGYGRAQLMTMTGAGLGSSGFTPTCSQSTTFLAAATGVTLDADKQDYDNLICRDLVTPGAFSKCDVIQVWAAPTRATSALINLVNPGTYNGTEIGTPANWTAYVGYTGDGATFAIDSGLNPFSASGTSKYQRDDAAVIIYVQTDAALGAGDTSVGADSVGGMGIIPAYFGSTHYRINNPSNKTVVVATSKGLWIESRTANSGAGAVNLYKDGNTTAIDSDSATADFVPRVNINFFAGNNGSPTNFSSLQMSAGAICNGLTNAAGMAVVATALNNYMTAKGHAVY